jgi:hypothetical protein
VIKQIKTIHVNEAALKIISSIVTKLFNFGEYKIKNNTFPDFMSRLSRLQAQQNTSY